MVATNYISFDLHLNECQLQQADEQNKKAHVKVLSSNLQLWSHITNKLVPYQYNGVESNSMLKRGRGQESLNGILISEEFQKIQKTDRHKKFNNPNKK